MSEPTMNWQQNDIAMRRALALQKTGLVKPVVVTPVAYAEDGWICLDDRKQAAALVAMLVTAQIEFQVVNRLAGNLRLDFKSQADSEKAFALLRNAESPPAGVRAGDVVKFDDGREARVLSVDGATLTLQKSFSEQIMDLGLTGMSDELRGLSTTPRTATEAAMRAERAKVMRIRGEYVGVDVREDMAGRAFKPCFVFKVHSKGPFAQLDATEVYVERMPFMLVPGTLAWLQAAEGECWQFDKVEVGSKPERHIAKRPSHFEKALLYAGYGDVPTLEDINQAMALLRRAGILSELTVSGLVSEARHLDPEVIKAEQERVRKRMRRSGTRIWGWIR